MYRSRENRKENWYFVKDEYCYAPPTWSYSKAQLALMAHMAHRKMPARVTDELLGARKMECLPDSVCKELLKKTEDLYKEDGVEWYRETQER